VSPTLGAPVALAMIKYAAAKAGTSVTIGDRSARIVDRPA
jgi:glycine cleavage system aminomethyltransferase T